MTLFCDRICKKIEIWKSGLYSLISDCRHTVWYFAVICIWDSFRALTFVMNDLKCTGKNTKEFCKWYYLKGGTILSAQWHQCKLASPRKTGNLMFIIHFFPELSNQTPLVAGSAVGILGLISLTLVAVFLFYRRHACIISNVFQHLF